MTDLTLPHDAAPATQTDQPPTLQLASTPDTREVLSGRLFDSLIGGMELLTVDVGLSTGLYAALAEHDATAAELATRSGLDARYVREWVEQQAAASLIQVDDAALAPGERRYRLDDGHAEVLLDPTSPYHLAPAGMLLVGLGRTTPDVREAFVSGDGVAYSAYGDEIREGIAGFNRPMIVGEMADVWLPAMGDAHAEFAASDTLRVIDVGCGVGWSTIALAMAYPHAEVRGVDLDPASVAAARENAASSGVADRVGFTLADAATFEPDGRADLVTCFETVHDMADPVAALRMARGALRDGGHLLVADERAADEFSAPADEMERFLHAFSVLHCLPATRAEPGPVAHGTMARSADVLGWFEAAGFTETRVLDIDNDMWRFYVARR